MDALGVLLARLRTGGQRPLLTFVDGASGERTELAYTAFENWTAKTANYLVEEHAVAAGDRVGFHAAPHWTAAVAAVGAWRAGACPDLDAGGIEVAAHPFGWRDVLAHDDHFSDVTVDPDAEALPGLSRAAAAAEADWHLDDGARLLCTAPLTSVAGLVRGLLGVLAVGGSLVAAANLDPATLERLAAQERTTHRLPP